MSSNNDMTNQTGGSSSITLAFVLGPVALGVLVYISIRYWSSLIRERHARLNGDVAAHTPTLGLKPSEVGSLPTFIYCGANQNVSSNTDVSDNHNHNSHNISNGKSNRNVMANGKIHEISIHCSICLCDLEEDDVVRMLPVCRHFFHIQCIDLWLYSHASCPICRAELQIGSVVSTECSMLPPLPQFEYCDVQASGKANIPASTEKLVTRTQIIEFTEIVVEQETKMATSADNCSERILCNDLSEVHINIKDEIDIERRNGEYLSVILPKPEKQEESYVMSIKMSSEILVEAEEVGVQMRSEESFEQTN